MCIFNNNNNNNNNFLKSIEKYDNNGVINREGEIRTINKLTNSISTNIYDITDIHRIQIINQELFVIHKSKKGLGIEAAWMKLSIYTFEPVGFQIIN